MAPVSMVDERTPVLVPAESVPEWLAPNIRGRQPLEHFAAPEFSSPLDGSQLGDDAKRPVDDGPDLIDPVPSGEQLVAS